MQPSKLRYADNMRWLSNAVCCWWITAAAGQIRDERLLSQKQDGFCNVKVSMMMVSKAVLLSCSGWQLSLMSDGLGKAVQGDVN
jgi:hypothetical protein